MGKKQRNFRKIPAYILDKVEETESESCQVAVVLNIPLTELEQEKYQDLGLTVKDGVVTCDEVLPNVAKGKYSKRNSEGLEIVREDLPMITKSIHMGQRHPYGDTSQTPFELWADRKVYQREFEPPNEFSINSEVLNERIEDNQTIISVKFAINPHLSRADPDFEGNLLYQINIMQENLGSIDVYPSDATKEDFLKTVVLDWEFLPVGERDEVLEAILSNYKNSDDKVLERIKERQEFLAKMKPEKYVIGLNGNRRYFGAYFSDNLVVFENMTYGNAIYVMFESWQELSQLSRLELLKRNDDSFERIIHRADWKEKLKAIIDNRLGKSRGWRR